MAIGPYSQCAPTKKKAPGMGLGESKAIKDKRAIPYTAGIETMISAAQMYPKILENFIYQN